MIYLVRSIYIVHAAADTSARDKLIKTLRPYQGIQVRHKDSIMPGQNRQEGVFALLDRADVILFLVSSDFLGEDCSQDPILAHAYRQRARANALLVPVLLRPCLWEHEQAIKDLQMLPLNGQFLSQWPDQDAAYRNVAKELVALVEKLEGGISDSQEFPIFVKYFDKKRWLRTTLLMLLLATVFTSGTLWLMALLKAPEKLAPEEAFDRAEEAFKAEDYKQAIVYYSQFLEAPDNVADKAMVLNSRGLAHERLGHIDKACEDFQEACRLAPKLKDAKDNVDRVCQ